jgi:hypothetical protein
MEDVLDVYQRPPSKELPLVCLDEFAKQLLSETRAPVGAAPGRPARHDYEYVREGSITGFMVAMPHAGKRDVFVGHDGRRTAKDFAACLDHIATVLLPAARHGISLRSLRAGEGARLVRTIRNPLHSEARKLAEHRGNRDRHAGPDLSGPKDRIGGAIPLRGELLSQLEERRPETHLLAVHQRIGTSETESPLSFTLRFMCY